MIDLHEIKVVEKEIRALEKSLQEARNSTYTMKRIGAAELRKRMIRVDNLELNLLIHNSYRDDLLGKGRKRPGCLFKKHDLVCLDMWKCWNPLDRQGERVYSFVCKHCGYYKTVEREYQ